MEPLHPAVIHEQLVERFGASTVADRRPRCCSCDSAAFDSASAWMDELEEKLNE